MKSRRLSLPLAAVLALAASDVAPVGAGAASQPPPAARLIEAHVRWLGGWAALDAVRDITLEGDLAVAGLNGTLAAWLCRDGRERTEVDLKVMKSVEGVRGDDAWELNASGQVEDTGRDQAVNGRRSLDRAFSRHLRAEGVVLSLPGDAQKDGRAWSVVRFTYPDGDSYDLLIDADSGESVWSRSVEDGRETWTKVSDLRVVEGVRIPFRQETFAAHAAENQVVTWRRVAINTGPADSLFARPAPAAGPGFARLPAGAVVSGWQPVELFAERYVVLHGSVNGTAVDMILDSGAGMTCLDREFAASIGLRPEGAVAAQGTGGHAEAGLVGGVTVRVGDLALGPLSAAVLDLSSIGSRLGRPLRAILGKEVFHALVVDLDYPNSRIRFHDPAAFRYEGPGHRLELLAGQEGHKSVQLSIEGGEPVTVGLDTGQGGALTVYRHYAEARGLLTGRPVSERRSLGVGGATIVKTATLRSVTLAGYELRGVPAAFQVTDVGGAFDTQRQAGNLGAGLLARFRLLFDYGRGCLWLEPGPDLDAPLPKDRTGLGFVLDGDALSVDFVAPGSPAAADGWRPGERVTVLDGTPVTPEWWKIFAAWTHASPGVTVRLTLADGTVRALTLRDYY
jgi:predicted aspartyl protease